MSARPNTEYSARCAESHDDGVTKTREKVPTRTREKVQRRTSYRDNKVIEKIREFESAPANPRDDSLVTTSTPHTTPSNPSIESKSERANSPASKPVRIPIYASSGDRLKLFAVSLGLQLQDVPPTSFTYDLTPECIERAQRHPKGFIEALKRSFDKALSKHLPGKKLAYYLIADEKDGRLHLHGGFVASESERAKVADAMFEAWGAWKDSIGRRSRHQLDMNPDRCDEGWPAYAFKSRKQQERLKSLIKGRSYTVSDPARFWGNWAYDAARAIMLGKEPDNPYDRMPRHLQPVPEEWF